MVSIPFDQLFPSRKQAHKVFSLLCILYIVCVIGDGFILHWYIRIGKTTCSLFGHKLAAPGQHTSRCIRTPLLTEVLPWLDEGAIYQCKRNNIYLNLTKNQYFITKLLVGMKRDVGSRGGCVAREASVGSMGRRDDSWDHQRSRGRGGVMEDEHREKTWRGPTPLWPWRRGKNI